LEYTTFVDPSGISPKNVSSALDVARVFRSAIAYPEIREATQSNRFDMRTLAGRLVHLDPTNNLLSSYLNAEPYGIVAGKTGSLPEAGYCLGQVTRHPDGQQVITVVLGSDNHFGRFQEVKALTAWAFDVFSWKDD
jgi:D-alanyl-D-alanine endopeptidase (penicillin-binding protein 7)